MDTSKSEKRLAMANHSPLPLNAPELMDVKIFKVDLILERHDQWDAVLMQEYERSSKIPPPPVVELEVSDVLRRPRIQIAEPLEMGNGLKEPRGRFSFLEPPYFMKGPQSPGPSPVQKPQGIMQNVPAHLEKAFRQNPKDLNIFVPLSPGSFGHAREVANEINSQLFRLWLDRCRGYHRTICGGQGSAVALKD